MASTPLNAADMIIVADGQATIFKQMFPNNGINALNEADTLCALANAMRVNVLGNGSSVFGISNASWRTSLNAPVQQMPSPLRYDNYSRGVFATVVNTFNSMINGSLPQAWLTGRTAMVGASRLDQWLTYLNGAYGASAAPNGTYLATPGSAGTVAAVNVAKGALPNCSSGNAPVAAYGLMGASYNLCSLPSANATPVAIAGANNGLTLTIGGTVPTGCRFVPVWRTAIGFQSGPLYLDQIVPVTAGASFPVITLSQPDSGLLNIQPPSWMQGPFTAEFAAIWACIGSANLRQSSITAPPTFNPNSMLSSWNVALNPGTNYQGVGNAPSGAIFGLATITGSGTNSYGAGTIQTVNNPANNLQGFCGAALNLQGRVTTVLNGTCTPTIGYTYYDAAHGWGVAQTASGLAASGAISGTAVGSTCTFAIPSGQIVQTVTAVSVSGSATSGAFVLEATPVRTY